MSHKPLITVFGATGAQGGGLAQALLHTAERPFRVRAVTRRPGSVAAQMLAEQGAEICAADIDDAAGVERAMRGAHGAFCVTSFWEHGSPDRELRQAANLAQGAQRAAVRHVVWSTLEDTRRFVEADGSLMPVLAERYNVPHHDAKGHADRFFIERGVPLTRLLTSFHWDNLFCGCWTQRGGDGSLALVLPMGAARLPGIAAADIGQCAAALFGSRTFIGRRIGIAGEHLSGEQMARALTRALGEPVRHVAMDPADYASSGLPGAAEMANMFRFKREFEAEYCAARDPAVARALYPGLLRFDDFLASHAAQLPSAAHLAA